MQLHAQFDVIQIQSTECQKQNKQDSIESTFVECTNFETISSKERGREGEIEGEREKNLCSKQRSIDMCGFSLLVDRMHLFFSCF